MKHCPRCKTTKPLDSFYLNSHRKDGRQSHCKPCQLANNKSYNWRARHDPGSIKKLDLSDHANRASYGVKLNKADIILIRGLFDFLTVGAIAEKFEVSKATIHRIKSGRSWSWVK